MKYLKFKDKKKRFLFNKNEEKNFFFKTLLYDNQCLNDKIKIYYLKKYLNNKVNNHVIIKNRCLLSNNSKFIFRFFRLSRNELKRNALSGFLLGVRKSSW